MSARRAKAGPVLAGGDGIWEPTAWMREAIERRGRELEQTLGEVDAIVIAPLMGPMTVPGSREDRSCDRCGAFVPEGRTLWVGAVPLARDCRVLLTFGLCDGCRAREVAS